QAITASHERRPKARVGYGFSKHVLSIFLLKWPKPPSRALRLHSARSGCRQRDCAAPTHDSGKAAESVNRNGTQFNSLSVFYREFLTFDLQKAM
ncbi:MAG TPA: hypothetical protein DCP57_07500, partial [Gammaproteobacteria bacterium]|nr:hypothetical protein [Gammaproteobacteria bacterium]